MFYGRLDYFTHFEASQSLGRAKRGDPRDKQPDRLTQAERDSALSKKALTHSGEMIKIFFFPEMDRIPSGMYSGRRSTCTHSVLLVFDKSLCALLVLLSLGRKMLNWPMSA